MGNNNMRTPFCCKGRRGFDACLEYDAAEEGDLDVATRNGMGGYLEYIADQSEVDMERGVTLVSVLKNGS